ncbi:hypothetical protein OV203_05345 [Nannocystis sp. ILAH1]|uniref:hypothetical protein n=1 Tax=unclassified Nannocystis TaxID=2627009 RepID=UPI002270E02F|nr:MULTISPECIES: hypothetical protein [unclassified Nannocystis]MCY0986532.1 hypothetical protein [Nannocystis sp. ILAH1]MCY1071412.1 hypothetical protein [Nannocystis sp. RBIL2]
MTTFTFSKELAPVPISWELLEQCETSLLLQITQDFYVDPEGIRTTLTLISQEYSEMASGVQHYSARKLPEGCEVAILSIRCEQIGLDLSFELSPIQRGKIYLSGKADFDRSGTRLKGLWSALEALLRSRALPTKLPQPSTSQMSARIPSCRIGGENLTKLGQYVDAALKQFLGQAHRLVEDIDIVVDTRNGSRAVPSLGDVCDILDEVRKVDVRIRRGSKDRSADVTITLDPKSRENQLSVSLSAFDDPSSLSEGAKIVQGLTVRIASRRTYHHVLYWGPHRGLLAYMGIVFICELFLLSDRVSAVILLPLLMLPFAVMAARRRFPYIVFEPFKLATFDQVLTVVVPAVFTLVLLPVVITWLSGAD